MPNASNSDKQPNDQFDVPWKEIVEGYFREFLAFFLPEAHNDIDWDRGHAFLDTELARITREAEIGNRRMDNRPVSLHRLGVALAQGVGYPVAGRDRRLRGEQKNAIYLKHRTYR
ncbi:MAG: hypothetical protein HQM03_12865 [Magnetococcales bacterium]|nr:hypothetical protein [Magnetococcales bacterium]